MRDAIDRAARRSQKLTDFVTALGAEPRVLDPRAHDRMLAFLSHLPQLTASALMQVVGDAVGDEGLALAGRGLADTTRLASSPPDIWQDIAATNADEIGPALDALIAVLQDLRGDLSEGERLNEVFVEAARWRASAEALRLTLGVSVDTAVANADANPRHAANARKSNRRSEDQEACLRSRSRTARDSAGAASRRARPESDRYTSRLQNDALGSCIDPIRPCGRPAQQAAPPNRFRDKPLELLPS